MKILSLRNIVLFSIILVSFCACNKPVKYSCDEKTNDFVIENIKKTRGITRDNLVKYPFEVQVPIFRSLSNKEKYDVYFQKIQKVVKEFPLSQKEKDYCMTTITSLTPEIYNSENESNLDNLSNQVKAHCIKEFGWTENQYVLIFEIFSTESEMKQAYLDSKATGNNLPKQGCVCKYSIACMWSGGGCEEGGCENASGCGFLGGAKCKGLCAVTPKVN